MQFVDTNIIDMANPVNWQSPLAKEMEAWWKVMPNGLGGSTLRDLTGRHHGTLTDMEPASDWSRSTHPGGYGSLAFDGTSEEVVVANDARLFGMPGLTLAAWVRYTGSSFNLNESNVFDAWNSGDTNYLVRWLANSNAWGFHIDTSAGSAGGSFAVATGSDDNLWHFIVATYDGSTLRFYEDGIESVTTFSRTGTIDAGSTAVSLGGQNAGSTDFWEGEIDDWMLWRRGLSAVEAGMLYNESRRYFPGLINRIRIPIGKAPAVAVGGPFPHYIRRTMSGGMIGMGT